MLADAIPRREHILACAREGVQTFWARYGVSVGARRSKP
jgi:hypothetical protein